MTQGWLIKKPCPFCGQMTNYVVEVDGVVKLYKVVCTNCLREGEEERDKDIAALGWRVTAIERLIMLSKLEGKND